MKKNFFTHIFLPILAVFILVLNIFSIYSFGSSTINIDGSDYTVSDFISQFKNLVIITDRNSFFTIIFSDCSFFYDNDSDYNHCCVRYNASEDMPFYAYYSNSFDDINFSKKLSSLNSDAFALSKFTDNSLSFSGRYNYDYIIYSNHDVYDNEGNILFQSAPQEVEQVTIPAISQVGEIPVVMTTAMKIIIPIGLIVLSIGLVIYLMQLVILRRR